MPMELRKFVREVVEAEGYSAVLLKSGHYWVLTPAGGKLVPFAVIHSRSAKGGEVRDCYVSKVRNSIRKDKQRAR
jgi:hypothetical protein